MSAFTVTVRRKDPTDRMIVEGATEAAAVEQAIRAFGGLGVVEFVSVEAVPTDSLEQALERLQAEADAPTPES